MCYIFTIQVLLFHKIILLVFQGLILGFRPFSERAFNACSVNVRLQGCTPKNVFIVLKKAASAETLNKLEFPLEKDFSYSFIESIYIHQNMVTNLNLKN